MALSDIQICNMALGRLGIGKRIQALTEESAEARACNFWYADRRDYLLAKCPWPFATRRVALALVSELTDEGWAFAYRYPSDALMVHQIEDITRAVVYYDIVSDGTGRLIRCDEEAPYIYYTTREENAAVYTPQFANALAWLLASEIGIGLNSKQDNVARAQQQFEFSYREAIADSFKEMKQEHAGDVPSIEARKF